MTLGGWKKQTVLTTRWGFSLNKSKVTASDERRFLGLRAETTLRCLHLSDIHFGQEKNGTIFEHEDVRDMLTNDAADIAKSRGNANLVIVTGDMVYGGQEAEYRRAGDWLDKLTVAVGCDVTDVCMVPGNHDCNRQAVNRVCRSVHQELRKGDSNSIDAYLHDLGEDSDDMNPLLQKLKAYRDFSAGYNSDFNSPSKPIWTKDVAFAEGITLRFVGMNSVQVSDDDDEIGKMILGSAQYILPTEANVVYVVLIHHPLDWLKDKIRAKQYLHNRASVIMVGHEHIPRISKTIESGRERLDISSGATNPPESKELYKYSYNWIEFSFRDIGNSFVLDVELFPRAWVPERACFMVDSARLDGEDSCVIDINCSNVKPATVTNNHISAVSPITAPIAHDLDTGNVENKTHFVNGDAIVSEIDEAAFAKLKFLFWRHLNWQQRIKVLVQADVLPSSAVQPVPQTLERLAIDTARKQGKLAAVWDAMASFLPPDKQQENPFSSTRI